MNVDLSALSRESGATRLLIEAELRPVQGTRFQPTGFPDLGAAVFETADGTNLLVESPQSMANRLEAVCWDPARQRLTPDAEGLSYVQVLNESGAFITSSVLESHRLNSPYILESADKSFFDALVAETASLASGPIDRRHLAEVVMKYDVNSLLHGLFLAKKELAGGRLRIERALSSFVEAEDVRVAASGGVKVDHVDPSGEAKKGFGHVPFQRDEYTAARIVAYVSFDLAQIRGYGLPATAERLLLLLGLYKIQALLSGDLRFRTACDLEVVATRVTRPDAYRLPALDALRGDLRQAIGECAPLFAGTAGVTSVRF